MARKVLISFVGGRPLPNIQFILKERPDRLYLISSKDSAGIGGSKEKIIHALPTELQPYKTFDVNPYIMKETIEKCEMVLSENQNQDDSIIFHLSSEPKIMALGVYDFIVSNKHYHNLNLFNSSRDGIVNLLEKDVYLPTKHIISLENYFKVYGWEINKKALINDQFSKLIELLLENIEESHSLLYKFRQNNKGKGKRSITITKTSKTEELTNNEHSLLLKIKDLGFVYEVKKEQKALTLTYDTEQETILKGDWLEYLVYKTAIENNFFDECAWNVEGIGQIGELDFVGIYNGQLTIASCKTENGIEAKYLKELSARADQLGKGMCTKVFITSYNPIDKSQYEKWSKEYNVSIVYGCDLKNIATKLKEAKEDKNRI